MIMPVCVLPLFPSRSKCFYIRHSLAMVYVLDVLSIDKVIFVDLLPGVAYSGHITHISKKGQSILHYILIKRRKAVKTIA